MIIDSGRGRIEKSIFFIRGLKVMPDADLAELYQVSTKVLNRAVKRNEDRFPADFMFQLTPEEFTALRSQIVTLESGAGDDIGSTFPTHLPNKEWPCFPAFYEASEP